MAGEVRQSREETVQEDHIASGGQKVFYPLETLKGEQEVYVPGAVFRSHTVFLHYGTTLFRVWRERL